MDTTSELSFFQEGDKDIVGMLRTDCIRLSPQMTVAEALCHIRKSSSAPSVLPRAFVTDEGGALLGTVDIVTLLRAKDGESVAHLTDPNAVKAPLSAGREEILRLFSRHGLSSLPIVDSCGRLYGVITSETVRDVTQDEAEEDFAKMSAMTPRETPYLSSSALSDFGSRVPWLMLLMLSATFTGMIISAFESSLSVCVYLTAFIPMLMGTGGNAGSQASVTVIRALSLGEIRLSDVFRILKKELCTALLCASVLAPAAFLKLLLVDHYLLGSLSAEGVLYAPLVVAFTLFLTVVLSKLIGALLPLLAKRLGFDPAVMAAPFITTAVDTVALALYFGIAKCFIPGL